MEKEFFVEEASWPGWFFMFVATLLLFATYACVQIHRRRATEMGTRRDAPLTSKVSSPIILPTNASDQAMNPNPLPPPIETRWKPGVSANPGGVPKGKRISTWMAEFGEMTPSKWPSKKQLAKMPANASIAMARIRKSATASGLRDTELVLDRTEGAVVPEPSTPMLSQIAAAIMALKAAGVVLRPTLEAEVVPQLPPPVVAAKDDDEDEFRSARLRRGRA